MRWILLVVLASCGSSSKVADAAVTPQMCETTFEAAVVRDCVAKADCVELIHPDCCGDVMIAVAATDQAAAQTAEGTYQTCINGACGARGCMHPLEAEDGMVPGTGQTIQMACVAGKCTTVVQ